jgi:hypothetical protein
MMVCMIESKISPRSNNEEMKVLKTMTLVK